MNAQNEKSLLSPPNLSDSLMQAVSAAPKGTATSAASDCLYQFAALTAGAFLLATLI